MGRQGTSDEDSTPGRWSLRRVTHRANLMTRSFPGVSCELRLVHVDGKCYLSGVHLDKKYGAMVTTCAPAATAASTASATLGAASSMCATSTSARPLTRLDAGTMIESMN